MKGISLPTNMIIIVAIAALVLVAFGAFFLTSTGGGISDADAQRIFAGGCLQYCKPELYSTFQNGYLTSQNDPDFIKACVKLGYSDIWNRCLQNCPGCNVNIDSNRDPGSGMDRIFDTLSQTP
ncbi:MAG TPA: hypothetical protein VJB05_01190 [archaeon]|nr:hypothetical protein [archaeon]